MAAKPRPALAAAKKALQALERELAEKAAHRIEPTRQDATAVGADEDEQQQYSRPRLSQ